MTDRRRKPRPDGNKTGGSASAGPRRRAGPDRPPGPAPAPVLRGRVWVEAAGGQALTDAGADLLEQIAAAGSLSEAARRLGFSYRRAWMLMDAMNRRWPGPLATLSAGGRSGGGAALTELGHVVLRSFRDFQLQFEHFLDQATGPFAAATRGAGNAGD